ncbi:MAG: ABC transporter ATP-binding protein [Candidatus Lokiarchaeota archaeon]|nr:ABC transporter ATP-binding protein [Candidatus Lokiarchaeota archaeon]
MVVIVRAEDVKKIYMQGKIEVPALRGISFTINEGEFVSILGPSGSGKSTLLNILGALDSPTEGKILLDGSYVSEMKEKKRVIHRQKVGFVFQSLNLIPHLTAIENIELSMNIQGISRSERYKKAIQCLRFVGLSRWIRHKPNELSGGQRQRVAIARALARIPRPSFLLMDEPTGNVDIKSRDIIMDLICKLNKEYGITIVIITHDIEVAKLADRTLYLVDGLIFESEEEYVKKIQTWANNEYRSQFSSDKKEKFYDQDD